MKCPASAPRAVSSVFAASRLRFSPRSGFPSMADAKAAALESEADVEEGAEGAEKPKSKFALKLPPLKFLIIGVAALALVGGGVGAYLMFFSHKEEAKVDEHAAKPAVFVDLP